MQSNHECIRAINLCINHSVANVDLYPARAHLLTPESCCKSSAMGSIVSRVVLLGDKLARADDPAAAAVCEKCMFVLKLKERRVERFKDHIEIEKDSNFLLRMLCSQFQN